MAFFALFFRNRSRAVLPQQKRFTTALSEYGLMSIFVRSSGCPDTVHMFISLAQCHDFLVRSAKFVLSASHKLSSLTLRSKFQLAVASSKIVPPDHEGLYYIRHFDHRNVSLVAAHLGVEFKSRRLKQFQRWGIVQANLRCTLRHVNNS